MKNLLTTVVISTIFLFSCTDNNQRRPTANNNSIPPPAYSVTAVPDTAYMFTGFYYLAEEGEGVKMRKDFSNEVYDIVKAPFVSVKNISRVTAQKNVIEGRDTYGVNIVLDNAGTKDLEQGTGNPSHPYIAVVFANRLLYVVQSVSKIKTGIMEIGLSGYSEKQVNDMLSDINHKR